MACYRRLSVSALVSRAEKIVDAASGLESVLVEVVKGDFGEAVESFAVEILRMLEVGNEHAFVMFAEERVERDEREKSGVGVNVAGVGGESVNEDVVVTAARDAYVIVAADVVAVVVVETWTMASIRVAVAANEGMIELGPRFHCQWDISKEKMVSYELMKLSWSWDSKELQDRTLQDLKVHLLFVLLCYQEYKADDTWLLPFGWIIATAAAIVAAVALGSGGL